MFFGNYNCFIKLIDCGNSGFWKMDFMEELVLHIKNMVCPRCIMAVEDILDNLSVAYQNLTLGQVRLSVPISSAVRVRLGESIKDLGFELLEPGKSLLISQIKTLIVQQIHYSEEPIQVNFSTYISEKLHQDYGYLSRLFSTVEGITIEKFIVKQRIEKVKEFLFYDELTLSEIGHKMNYSSVAHLSAQFKKETGMTPTSYKQNISGDPDRRPLDSL